jgi:hypothetical protein
VETNSDKLALPEIWETEEDKLLSIGDLLITIQQQSVKLGNKKTASDGQNALAISGTRNLDRHGF